MDHFWRTEILDFYQIPNGLQEFIYHVYQNVIKIICEIYHDF
jgi:hypothetical protein